MNHRKKMCEHCAFREGSLETSSGEKAQDLLMGCLTKKFYCHETMYQKNEGVSKWMGNFDDKKKRDGTPAGIDDHQVCAGFMLMFGDEFGVDTSDIAVENHHFFGGD